MPPMTARQRLICALLCTTWVVFGGIRLATGSTGSGLSTALTVISVLSGAVGLIAVGMSHLERQR